MAFKSKESIKDETIKEEAFVAETINLEESSLLSKVLANAPSKLHDSLTLLVEEIEKLKK